MVKGIYQGLAYKRSRKLKIRSKIIKTVEKGAYNV